MLAAETHGEDRPEIRNWKRGRATSANPSGSTSPGRG